MTKLTFHVIDGGRPAGMVEAVIASTPFSALFDPPAAREFAASAERDAFRSAGPVTAAVAVLAKDEAELTAMIAAAGGGQAADTHATLRRALAGADVLVAVLRAAEVRFSIARAGAAFTADHSR
jgi:hypothetical protein